MANRMLLKDHQWWSHIYIFLKSAQNILRTFSTDFHFQNFIFLNSYKLQRNQSLSTNLRFERIDHAHQRGMDVSASCSWMRRPKFVQIGHRRGASSTVAVARKCHQRADRRWQKHIGSDPRYALLPFANWDLMMRELLQHLRIGLKWNGRLLMFGLTKCELWVCFLDRRNEIFWLKSKAKKWVFGKFWFPPFWDKQPQIMSENFDHLSLNCFWPIVPPVP